MESFDCSKAEDVERLYNLVAKAALSKTSYIVHSSAAEEIVQETFIKLFNKKPKFSSVRQAYAWIYRTCTNGAIDFLRKKDNSDWGQDSQDLLDSSRFGPEEKTHLKQAYEGLLKDLDEKEAQYFVFNYIEALTQEEMAEVMKVSRRTITRIADKVSKKIERRKERSKNG